MPNEVRIKVGAQTQEAEKGAKRTRSAFEDLRGPLRGVGLGLSAVAAGGFLVGRNLVSAAMQAGTTSEAFFEFKDASFELRRTLGELIIEVISPLIGWLASLMERLREVNPTLLKVVVAAGLVATALAGIGGPIFIVLSLIPSMLAGVAALTGAFGALSVAMGPITAIVLGITAAVAAGIFIWRNWESIMEGVRSSLSKMDSMLGGLLSSMGLVTNAAEESGEAHEGFRFGLLKLIPGIGNVLSLLENLSKKEIDWKRVLLSGLAFVSPLAQLTLIADTINGFFQKHVDIDWKRVLFGNLADINIDWMRVLFGDLLDFDWAMLWRPFKDGWLAFTAWFAGTAWPGFVGLWVQLWQTVRQFTGKAWEKIRDAIKEGWSAVSEWFTETAWPAFRDFWVDGWNSVKDTLADLWDAMKDMAADKWESIKETILSKVQVIIDKINSFIAMWNNLEFQVPEISLPFGGSVGGFSVGTPNIPSIPGVPALAEGGRARRGGMALVGERGPELLNLPRGAEVSPMSKTGPTVVWNQNAPIYGFIDFENQVTEVVRDAFLSGAFRGAM